MPRVPDQLLQAVVFLYPTAEAARVGEQAGGTGFFIRVRARSSGQAFDYLVTNDHVANAQAGGRDMVVRANASNGFELLSIDASEWVGHPDADDVALARVDIPRNWDVKPIEWADFFPTPERMAELNFGIGDEVVMIGRFVGHEGRATNQPVARFGNVALMPGERILDGRGLRVEAYLAEMRSLPGFSGSPVFVYIGPGSYRGNNTMMPFYSETIGLIGIDTGHKYQTSGIHDRETGQKISEPWEVRQNSGLAIVAPAIKIADVLAAEQLVKQRTERQQQK